ncbi:hypothetical protein B5808_02645 [Cnuibacter physcomitrellae]|uniref:Gram-positive cocci surface proteins LPxTG domain-containing protein n=2 Tax=Cnuibacter physcomitrellae TaxID=1619308 RepID=A0A1X9LGA3_9MICO|nr:hypothetical protein B5808_02645 [Cnuibacter physcomitrellae]
MTGAFGQAAIADDGQGDAVAPTSGPAFDAQAKSLLQEDGIQAVATDGDGNVVVLTTEAQDALAGDAKAFIDSNSNVVVRTVDAPFSAFSDKDVVGGAGYLVGTQAQPVGSCSVGFSGFNKVGDPVVISAGHCAVDETDPSVTYDFAALTRPQSDTAGGGSNPVDYTALGQLDVGQFGGPGNSAGAEGDVSSVDISVWNTAGDLTLLPEVSTWSSADIAANDLSIDTVPVTGIGDATVGATINKSGRTTGYTQGTVEAINGWANVSGHEVYGFLSNTPAAPGDSGGAMIQNGAAIGVISGGTTAGGAQVTWGANLKAAIAQVNSVAGEDYTVAVFLSTPVLTSPADGGQVYTGGAITGTATPNTTLSVQLGADTPFTVPVDANGNWTITAPTQSGTASYRVISTSGFSESAALEFDVDVIPAPLPSPVFTSPTDGQRVVTSLEKITGTGTPGATVELTGDVTDEVEVAADGTWSVDADLAYGVYSVSAIQTTDTGDASDSAPAAVSFAVVPVAPVITSPTDGASFALGSAPTTVSGTGIDGATVVVSWGTEQTLTATVANGTWSVTLPAQLAAGQYTFAATQAIDGVASDPALAAVTVVAPTGGGNNSTPAGLANTGAEVAPLAITGLALLFAAGGAMLLARRARRA